MKLSISAMALLIGLLCFGFPAGVQAAGQEPIAIQTDAGKTEITYLEGGGVFGPKGLGQDPAAGTG